jgi:hypothetical protein
VVSTFFLPLFITPPDMMNMAGMTPMMQQQFLMMQQQQLQQQQLQQQQLQQQQSQQQQSTQQSMGFPGMGSMMMPGVMGMAHPIAMMQTMPASQSGDQGVQARPQAGVNEGGKRRTGQQHGPAQVPQGDFSGPGEQPGFEHAEQGEQHDRQGQRREPQQPRQPKWKPTRVLELLVIEKKKTLPSCFTWLSHTIPDRIPPFHTVRKAPAKLLRGPDATLSERHGFGADPRWTECQGRTQHHGLFRCCWLFA